jgi:type II secretory pathway pseudopilin PulG
MRLARADGGFTLLETLAATFAAIVVFGATLSVLDVFQSGSRLDNLRNEAQDSARTAIDALARELRNGAAPSSLTPGALEKAGKYSVVFQTIEPTTSAIPAEDANKTNAIRVRYCLNNSQPSNEILYKQTRKWTTERAPELPTIGTCPDPNPADYETSIQVAAHIVNRSGGRTTAPLFTYIPANWTSVAQVIGVEPDLYLNVNPGQSHPGETQLASSLDLRNENRPPLAAFTATEVGSSRVVELNGSQSTDPDGLALTYKWWDNAEQLPTTSAETETKALALGSTHVFKLEVITPSGLSASEQVELKIT